VSTRGGFYELERRYNPSLSAGYGGYTVPHDSADTGLIVDLTVASYGNSGKYNVEIDMDRNVDACRTPVDIRPSTVKKRKTSPCGTDLHNPFQTGTRKRIREGAYDQIKRFIELKKSDIFIR
jgi:hypothetical protein